MLKPILTKPVHGILHSVVNHAPRVQGKNIITAVIVPALGMLRDGDAIGDFISADINSAANYSSTEGAISSVEVVITVNGSTATTATTVSYTDKVQIAVTVTDNAANQRVWVRARTVAGIVPVNTVAVSISGSAVLDGVLTVAAGSWTGVPAPDLTYQWLRDEQPISGETGNTYTITMADSETVISVRETATNSAGAESVVSNIVSVPDLVIPDPVEPTDPELPALNEPRDFGAQTLMSGASYTNFVMPAYFDTIVNHFAESAQPSTLVSITNGSNWTARWENTAAQGVDAKTILQEGTPPIDIFSITDLSGMEPNFNVITHGVLWNELSNSAGAEIFFYALTGRGIPQSTEHEDFWTFREDQERRIANWESVTDSVIALSDPTLPRPTIIPAGKVFARIYDEIELGNNPPEIDNIWLLFGELDNNQVGDGHQSRLGRFVIAMTHYATIYRRSPVGGPTYAQVTGQAEMLSPAALLWLQELVWDVVEKYEYSGVRAFNPVQDWVFSSVLDDLTVFKTPNESAANYTLRLQGDTNQSNWLVLAAPLPVTFSDLAEGVYELSDDDGVTWSDPINVDGRVVSSIETVFYSEYKKPGNTVTSGQSGVDVPYSEDVENGDLLLLVGSSRSLNGNTIYAGNTTVRGPAHYLTNHLPVSYPLVDGVTSSDGSDSVTWGYKDETVPQSPFQNINTVNDGGGGIFAFRGADATGVLATDMTDGELKMAIEVPPVEGVTVGSKVITIVNARSNFIGSSVAVNPIPAGVEVVTNTRVSGNLHVFVCIQDAQSTTVPSISVQYPAAYALRSRRIVIPPAN